MHLVRALRDAGHSVLELSSADGDIADPATLERFQGTSLEFVFHLAGRTYVPDSWLDPADFQRVNVTGTVNVLELCRKLKIPMTYVSAYLYGIPASLPIKETDRMEPNNPYALSKFMAEGMCSFYAAHFDVPVTIIRPFNIYGPGQKPHFLIPEIVSQVTAGQSIRVKDMTPRRDYLYIDDLIDGLLCTMGSAAGCRVYNLGYGSSLSVKEIIGIIQSVAGTSLKIFCENVTRKNEIRDVYADIAKARQDLGWHPKNSLAEGIAKILGRSGKYEH